MMAMILAGGKGTRIRELYDDRPKALVPVAGRPFIEWQLDWLRNQGITRVHFSAGFMADHIQEWINRRPGNDMDITLFAETEARGTGGAVQANRHLLQDSPFLVLNGDSLSPNVSLTDLIAQQEKTQCTAALAVTYIEEAARFGTVQLNAEHQIEQFLEKQHAASGYVNCGIYCIHPDILSLIPEQGSCSIETQIFPQLAEQKKLTGLISPAPLLDMGTPDGLNEMESYLMK